MYDTFILSLTVMSIVGALVCSYKLRHSPIYPVGIVRETPGRPSDSRPSSEDLELQPDPDAIRKAAYPSRYFFDEMSEKDLWRCENCALVQIAPKDLMCRRCDHPLTSEPKSENSLVGHGGSALQKKLSQQDRKLESLETRVRRLEVDSVERSREIPEEKPQNAHEFVN